MKGYQHVNGYYIGEYTLQPSPLEEGVFLCPPDVITVKPIDCEENEIPFWNGEEWVKKPDFSKKTYYNTLTCEAKKFQIGENLDPLYTDKKPLEGVDQKFENGNWVVDTVKELEKRKNKVHEEYTKHKSNIKGVVDNYEFAQSQENDILKLINLIDNNIVSESDSALTDINFVSRKLNRVKLVELATDLSNKRFLLAQKRNAKLLDNSDPKIWD